MEKSILSILVDNKPGVLSRIVGLFSGRGYNIDSLCVAETTDPKFSRLTMVTTADKAIVEQIKKQLHKLINVITVYDYTDQKYVSRELAIIKVNATASLRAEILRIVDIFRCKIVDSSPEHYTLQVSADEEKLEALLNLLKPMGIKEVVRTGCVALARGSK
ncbi:MAG: acetolactate synthase small subunit [Deltaproteobacteria bacterium]|nr:MAG: acetolactate synthase small subunit [Deltaproteobacteria bacterium]PIE74708.1 MAG: acetolactate synthase small subunit [Deltaproteobacteria bacterium]